MAPSVPASGPVPTSPPASGVEPSVAPSAPKP
jgi:hypothetical protein